MAEGGGVSALAADAKTKSKPSGTSFEGLMGELGYEHIPARRDESNQLLVGAMLDGKRRVLQLDTGCGLTTLSKSSSKHLKSIAELGVVLRDSFWGDISRSNIFVMERLQFGKAVFLNQPAERETSRINFGDGLLGVDFMHRNWCILECASPSLFVRGSPPGDSVQSTFQKSLELSGFKPVKLALDRGVMLTCELSINGKSAVMLVDSGAFLTCIDQSLLRSFELSWRYSGMKVSGIKAYKESLHVARAPSVKIGGVEIGTQTIGAIDLEKWGLRLPKANSMKVDGILGADLLGITMSVIDFHNTNMWVLPPPGANKK